MSRTEKRQVESSPLGKKREGEQEKERLVKLRMGGRKANNRQRDNDTG